MERREGGCRLPHLESIRPVCRWQGECRQPHSLPQASLSVLGRAVRNQDLCSGPDFHRSTHPYEHEVLSLVLGGY